MNTNEIDTLIKNSGKKSGSKKVLIILLILILLIVLAYVFFTRFSVSEGVFETVDAKKGDIVVNITASGTLQPVTSVDVSTEVSGTLQEVLVDANDVVKQGQIIAKLDTSKLVDAVGRSQASVKSAIANNLMSKASLKEAQENLFRLQKAYELSGGKVPSKAELSGAEIALERSKASVEVSSASVTQAQANLKTDKTNLEKAIIRSPINGIVLARKVENGQTIAASMNAPVLFTIAEDLAKMELIINIDEADVSSVKPDQKASFTVSAYGSQQFPAHIKRIDVGSTTNDNVVTYKTTLSVNNEKMQLRPGMTASTKIITADKKDVLLVPNTALRFNPPQLENGSNSSKKGFSVSFSMRPPSRNGPKTAGENNKGSSSSKRNVWILENGMPKKIEITTGVTNGRMTEVESGELKVGDKVITTFTVKK